MRRPMLYWGVLLLALFLVACSAPRPRLPGGPPAQPSESKATPVGTLVPIGGDASPTMEVEEATATAIATEAAATATKTVTETATPADYGETALRCTTTGGAGVRRVDCQVLVVNRGAEAPVVGRIVLPDSMLLPVAEASGGTSTSAGGSHVLAYEARLGPDQTAGWETAFVIPPFITSTFPLTLNLEYETEGAAVRVTTSLGLGATASESVDAPRLAGGDVARLRQMAAALIAGQEEAEAVLAERCTAAEREALEGEVVSLEGGTLPSPFSVQVASDNEVVVVVGERRASFRLERSAWRLCGLE